MSYQNTQEKIHNIHLIGDAILYNDEVLGMSARMGAVTGEKSWQERYDKHSLLLTSAIDEAFALVDTAKQPMEITKQANRALTSMEAQAFVLIGQGKKEEALKMLLSDTYLENKQIYSRGLAEMMKVLHKSKGELSGKRNANITLAAAISILTFGLIIFNIIVTFRRLRMDNTLLKRQLDIIDRYVITSTTDTSGIITRVSSAFCTISGYSKEELIGQPHNILRHSDMPKAFYKNLWETIKAGQIWHGEIKNRKKNGDYYWVDATIEPERDARGNIISYRALRFDITNKKRVEELSLTDAMTGLYNRRHFDTLLPKELKRSSREQQPLSLLILDIDHFKEYNDTYGHQQGDEALKAVANVINTSLNRCCDTAFRIGGEEFCVLLNNTELDGAKTIAQKIIEKVRQLDIEHSKSGTAAHLSISVGINTVLPDAYTSLSDIIEQADRYLYKAKQNGRNRFISEDEDITALS